VIALVAFVIALVALVDALVASVVKVFYHKGHPGGHKDHTVNDVMENILFE